MKISILPLRSKKQHWCIWITFANGVKTRLQKNYFNRGDAVDTANTLKDEMKDAVIVPFKTK